MTTATSETHSKLLMAMDQLEVEREEHGLDKGGKKYSMVRDRIRIFRQFFGTDFGINTEIEHGGNFKQGGVLIGKAKITDNHGTIVASGHAMEFIGSNEITDTSAVEAVETSAIGRALASFGLHGGEYASGDEMVGVDRKKMVVQGQANTSVQHPEIPRRNSAPVNLYVPAQPFAVGLDLGQETAKVCDVVAGIETIDHLSAYWTELREFRSSLEQNDPRMLAELKAAFAVRNNMMQEKG